MRVDRRFVLVAVLLLLGAGPSSGQSTYVSAAVVGDVLLNTHSETSLGGDIPSGGEAVGFSLRLGTPLGSRWGVELEFTRAGEIETEFDGVIPLSRAGNIVSWSSSLPPGSVPAGIDVVLPLLQRPTSYSLRTTQRHSTLSTTVWMNQELSDRVSLVYLAGMGFYRTTFETESRFDEAEDARVVVDLVRDVVRSRVWRHDEEGHADAVAIEGVPRGNGCTAVGIRLDRREIVGHARGRRRDVVREPAVLVVRDEERAAAPRR